MTREEYLELSPYSLDALDKKRELTEVLKSLTEYHRQNCPEYRQILDAFNYDALKTAGYEDIPPLPVRLFKEYELLSVPREDVFKTMTSSGTTGQQVSRIFLDRDTAALQSKIMTRIVSDFIGNDRLPMIIIDSEKTVKDRKLFSARGAGILGFSMFGRKRFYALDENMELDTDGLKHFLSDHEGERIFLFGFTFMIWQHFYKKLKETGFHPDLSNGIMIHGGGWKKLLSEAVSPDDFRKCLSDVCSIAPGNVLNYYGMVEQTGTIYMECECGHLHTSIFSDVLIRNPEDFSLQPSGEKGLVEVISVLPRSYPGHVLLTEDEGIIDGEDDCPCGRKGKYFRVLGRVKNAEIRGCSDTYADRM